jgi:DNA-directed RNA polymerase specialized sigma24 family protein
VPFRVVVHNVIGWTIKAHFKALKGEPLSLPDDYDVPGGSEVEYDDPIEPILARLTEHERVVFELRAMLGWTAKQVAEELGIDSNAVDQTYHRAKAKLRRFLDE